MGKCRTGWFDENGERFLIFALTLRISFQQQRVGNLD